ncbi:MAG TPA: BON domain-containing protein [Blastocatellia bacterium]|nr:BON domain-containing protein [Blastocatellia bacterium]
MTRIFFAATAFCFLAVSLACNPASNSNNANARANANATASANRTAAPGSRPDSWITLKVKLALLAESPTSGYETEVDTKDGVVTLTGKVDTNEARTEMESTARKIEGVTGVNDQLQVVPDAKRKEVNASDDKIEDEIGKAIDNDPKLKDLSLSADSNAGVVSLDGTVDTNDELLHAAQVIRKVPGVRSVVTSAVTVKE